MKRVKTLLALGVLLTASGCSSSLSTDRVSPGTYRQTMRPGADGPRRTYRLHVPQGYDPTRQRPLVVVIHGAYSNSRQMVERTGFDELADHEGFIVAYPDGIGVLGLLQHWNAGFCCGKALADGIDDVGFVAAVIDEVSRALAVDQGRVFLVGYSNGGMLAYRMAAEMPERLAGVAVFAATVGVRSSTGVEHLLPKPAGPLPVLHLHGRADENVPYEGGRPARGSFALASARESASFWAISNGCEGEPARLEERDRHVVRETWSAGCAETPVVLLSLEGWDHSWPGPHFTDRLDRHDPLRGFDAAEVIWDFLAAERRATPQ